MYLWALAQLMPTTPGLLWKMAGTYYQKSIMADQTSFVAQQWLYYMQEQSVCYENGVKVQMDHVYFRGEKVIGGYKVDGYINRNGKHVFFEFLGCKFHPGKLKHYLSRLKCFKGCCVNEIEDAEAKLKFWQEKKSFLKSIGELHVMRECKWKRQLSNMKNYPDTQMGKILEKSSEDDIIKGKRLFMLSLNYNQGIMDDTLYGFIICNVSTPQEVMDDMGSFLFPPIIKRFEQGLNSLFYILLDWISRRKCCLHT